MKIEPRSKYDAGRVARSLVNSRIPFTFECHPLTVDRDNPDLGFVFTTGGGISDKLILHVFRNMDDVGTLTPTDPLTAEETKRMLSAMEPVKW